MRDKAAKSRDELLSELALRLGELRGWDDKLAFGITPPPEELVNTLVPFLFKNPNNIGMHSGNPNSLRGTKRVEREVILALAEMMGDVNAEGWLTSGGTEGNLTAIWMGREYLYSQGAKHIALVSTSLFHESIEKATNILSITEHVIVQTDEIGRMMPSDLQAKLAYTQSLRGIDSFLVVPVVGASQTGACDPVSDICEILRRYCLAPYYIHVDASFGGFVLPFTNPEFQFDFSLPEVKSLVIDPHKMARTPLGCGVLLCRYGYSRLTHFKGRLGPADNVTLLGCRSGAMAVAAWYALFSAGWEGLRETALQCLDLKRYFCESLAQVGIRSDIIDEPAINLVAVRFLGFKGCRLPKNLEKSYQLTPSLLPGLEKENESAPPIYYAVKFMPHLKKESVDRFITTIIDAQVAQQGATSEV